MTAERKHLLWHSDGLASVQGQTPVDVLVPVSAPPLKFNNWTSGEHLYGYMPRVAPLFAHKNSSPFSALSPCLSTWRCILLAQQ